MHLQRLKLKNFRGFEALDLTLDERVTVLVGRNGSGKSSVLVAIARAAICIADDVFRDGRTPDFDRGDIRVGSPEAEILTHWQEPEFQHVVRVSASGPELAQASWEGSVVNEPLPPVPPLCIDYSTDRARARYDYPPRISHARMSKATLHPGWDDDFNSVFLTFERLRDWFREREDYENQERVQKQKLELVDPALDAVRRAATKVLGPGFGPPRIERASGAQLVVKKGDVTLSAEQLSDGERALLIIASNLARRLFLATPNAPDPLKTQAIVLIDEIELHLHPAWQRAILGRLAETFPKVQFIVSTHSAIVLSEVGPKSVRILEDFQVFVIDDDEPVYGRDVNALLRDILGGIERPAAIERAIHEISQFIDANDLEQAKRETDKLETIVGGHDSEVIRLRTMLDFLERPIDPADGG